LVYWTPAPNIYIRRYRDTRQAGRPAGRWFYFILLLFIADDNRRKEGRKEGRRGVVDG
jgi:hypothetical protein